MLQSLRYFLMVMLLVLTGCKKDNVYRVTGLLTDQNRMLPVAGAGVQIWTQKIESGVFVANYELVGDLLTASDGKFAFELANATYTGVRLVFSAKGYFGWQAQVNTADLSKERVQYSVYQMVPKAWLKLHIVNSQPFDEDDFFEYRLLNAYSNCDECCHNDAYRFYGMAVDQLSECLTAGHQQLIIQWSSRKNKVQDARSQEFFITAGDTTKIELVY